MSQEVHGKVSCHLSLHRSVRSSSSGKSDSSVYLIVVRLAGTVRHPRLAMSVVPIVSSAGQRGDISGEVDSQEEHVLCHPPHVGILANQLMVNQSGIQGVPAQASAHSHPGVALPHSPDQRRDLWSHSPLNLQLAHWETTSGESFHQADIEAIQVLTSLTINRQL